MTLWVTSLTGRANRGSARDDIIYINDPYLKALLDSSQGELSLCPVPNVSERFPTFISYHAVEKETLTVTRWCIEKKVINVVPLERIIFSPSAAAPVLVGEHPSKLLLLPASRTLSPRTPLSYLLAPPYSLSHLDSFLVSSSLSCEAICYRSAALPLHFRPLQHKRAPSIPIFRITYLESANRIFDSKFTNHKSKRRCAATFRTRSPYDKLISISLLAIASGSLHIIGIVFTVARRQL
ncbi:hypothetical protein TMatcc_000159 [Talaromyces marneffei ATCC 18224]